MDTWLICTNCGGDIAIRVKPVTNHCPKCGQMLATMTPSGKLIVEKAGQFVREYVAQIASVRVLDDLEIRRITGT